MAIKCIFSLSFDPLAWYMHIIMAHTSFSRRSHHLCECISYQKPRNSPACPYTFDIVFSNRERIAISFAWRHHCRMSKLDRDPLPNSTLAFIELLELRRRRCLWSLGSDGWSPDWRAKRFRISVKVITPVNRPEAPAVAETAGKVVPSPGEAWDKLWGETAIAGVVAGVAGAEGDGEDPSTIHIRCALVATSFAVVCARVE